MSLNAIGIFLNADCETIWKNTFDNFITNFEYMNFGKYIETFCGGLKAYIVTVMLRASDTVKFYVVIFMIMKYVVALDEQ